MTRELLSRFGKYFVGQVISYGFDMGSYILLLHMGVEIWLAVIVARCIGGIVAFIIHKHVTFSARSSGNAKREIVSYFILLFAMALISAPLVVWLSSMFNKYLSKIIADAITIVISFTMMRLVVFPVEKQSRGA